MYKDSLTLLLKANFSYLGHNTFERNISSEAILKVKVLF